MSWSFRSTLLGSGLPTTVFPEQAAPNPEVPLWESVAQEPARLSGVRARLYELRRAKNMHPLYREPSADDGGWEYRGPWELHVAIEFSVPDDMEIEAGQEGAEKTGQATCWLSEKEIRTAQAPRPKVGDVLEFWQTPGYAGAGASTWWDIVRADPDGRVMTTDVFVQWKLILRQRARFDAVRKVVSGEVG